MKDETQPRKRELCPSFRPNFRPDNLSMYRDFSIALSQDCRQSHGALPLARNLTTDRPFLRIIIPGIFELTIVENDLHEEDIANARSSMRSVSSFDVDWRFGAWWGEKESFGRGAEIMSRRWHWLSHANWGFDNLLVYKYEKQNKIYLIHGRMKVIVIRRNVGEATTKDCHGR